MKKLLIGLLTVGSFSAIAAEVCFISQLTNFSQDSFMNCSNVNSGQTKKVNQNSTVLLKKKVEEGYRVESTIIGEDKIVYTLIKN